ncbi:MAG TPA: diguanylate cyclase [Thermoanaerobaculia bacterium]|nr:diguanylate cyclase [Thermoanaerobaculia bacterium]
MELLLWRWSTTAQIASALMIAVFFAVLVRSVRRVELRPWVRAWLANLGALAVTSIFWLAQPQSPAMFTFLRGAYFFFKTLFVILLALGAWTFVRRRPVPLHYVLGGVALFALVMTFVVEGVNGVGVVQGALMGVLFLASAVLLIIRHVPASGWLAAGFGLRAVLAFIEAIAYGMPVKSKAVTIFLACHSSFDTGVEWVIALGCVLTLYSTIQHELTRSNEELVEAKERLQDLADRDSLTGLANRRTLREVFDSVQETGATIMFFDLDGFKEINDSYGHHAGDQSLVRFARGLRTSFRPQDRLVRYAGDEFVVIAPGVKPEHIVSRTEGLRDRLKFERGDGPPVRFSVGYSYLPPNGDPEAAMLEADQAMYRDKKEAPSRLSQISRIRLSSKTLRKL